MIILDEKMPPPPPYTPRPATLPTPNTPTSPPPFALSHRDVPTLMTLGPHILLRIVYSTFGQTTNIEKQRKVLYWLTVGLRLVNRAFYVGCMHVLRSTYLPAYSALVRPPYTSDPFPLSAPPPPSSPTVPPTAVSPVQSLQRETKVLDLFIVLKVREDVWADESELHLERDESFRDLFDLMQPRARMEDLLRAYGARAGVVSISRSAAAASRRGKARAPEPIPFGAMAVSFSSRCVGVILNTRERKRTIVEVSRTRDERLEVAAKKLVRELQEWIAANP